MPLSNVDTIAPYPKLLDSEYHEPAFDFSRFNNSFDLVEYGCSFQPDDHPTRRTGYDPVCPHPYVPAGWNLQPGGPNASEVVFGDCSQIIASSSITYNQVFVTYALISMVQVCMWLYFLKQINDAKLHKLKRFWWIPNPNVNEQIILICMLGSFNHVILSIDVDNAAGRLPIWLTDIFMALNFVCATSCNAILIISWVTVIDGGKNRKTPFWARMLKNWSIAASFTFEIGCSLLERTTGRAATFGSNTIAANGDIMSFKYLINAIVMTVYGIICFKYGRKITRMLRHGKVSVSERSVRAGSKSCESRKRVCRIEIVRAGSKACERSEPHNN